MEISSYNSAQTQSLKKTTTKDSFIKILIKKYFNLVSSTLHLKENLTKMFVHSCFLTYPNECEGFLFVSNSG